MISLPPNTPGAYPMQLTYQVAGTTSLAGGAYDGHRRGQAILDTPIRLTGDTVIAGRMGCGEGRIRGGIVHHPGGLLQLPSGLALSGRP